MQRRIFHLALAATFLLAAPVLAAPIVTMSVVDDILPGMNALDFFCTVTEGSDYLTHRITVTTTNGPHIQDPERGTVATGLHYDDVTSGPNGTGNGPRADTWANTVYSSLGLNIPVITQNSYDAIPPGQDSLPVSLLDWSVFDTDTGDGNDLSTDAGFPGDSNYMAPYHLGRVLVDNSTSPNGGAIGSARIVVFDSLTLEPDGVTPKPTAFEFGFSIVTLPESAEIEVRGNGVVILDGDNTPSTADHTDFGLVVQGNNPTRTYTIHNTGDAELSLGELTLSGAPEFQLIGTFPDGPIAPLGIAIFTIGLNGTNQGVFNGNVSFHNGDANENPYSFDITATVIPEPASLILVGLGLFGLIGFMRRQQVG